MRLAIFSTSAALSVGLRQRRPIRLTASSPIIRLGMWENGMFPVLGLPKTATPEQVIKRTFEMIGFDKGHVTSYTILDMRQVRFVAACQTCTRGTRQDQFGEKIVLFKYVGPKVGWWTRVVDANRATIETSRTVNA